MNEITLGATIMRIEKEKLRKMEIYDNFADHKQIIPSDDEICDNFMQQNNVRLFEERFFDKTLTFQWNFLKKAVLDDTVNRLPRKQQSIRSRGNLRPVSPTREGHVTFKAQGKTKKVSFGRHRTCWNSFMI